jgi:HPt (histidine-containing phosphotransfer) domain-containing protein
MSEFVRDPRVFDPEALAGLIGDDPELMQELIDLFNDEAPRLIGTIRSATAAGDPHTVTHAAHTLKGSAANLGAAEASEAALSVEMIGRSGDLTAAPGACERLEAALQRLQDTLVAFTASAR